MRAGTRVTFALTLTAFLLDYGCSRNSDTPTIDPVGPVMPSVAWESGQVQVLAEPDQVDFRLRIITVPLRVSRDDGPESTRLLQLAPSHDGIERGFTARMSDERGTLRVSVTQRWGQESDGTVHYYLSEDTPSDRLELIATRSGDQTVESYRFNGQSIRLEYEVGAPSMQSAQSEYAAFYEHQVDAGLARRTLEADNPDGRAMMTLLADAAFADWLHAFVPAGADPVEPPGLDCEYRCICDIASACAWLKCPFGGGWANFVCISCGGVSIACTIANFFI